MLVSGDLCRPASNLGSRRVQITSRLPLYLDALTPFITPAIMRSVVAVCLHPGSFSIPTVVECFSRRDKFEYWTVFEFYLFTQTAIPRA